MTTITAPSRERPVSLKIGLKSEAILIVSGFWRRIIFCREMGCSERIWFSTAMNRQATISADRIDEAAIGAALRPDRYVFHTIAEVVT